MAFSFPQPTLLRRTRSVFPGGYNIDPPTGEKNVCLVDSVGSQANRIEPMFAKPEYAELVPQIIIQAGEKSVNLLEAGHRAGDAIVRCTPLQKKLQNAFKAVLQGNALDYGEDRADISRLWRVGFARYSGKAPAARCLDDSCVRCTDV